MVKSHSYRPGRYATVQVPKRSPLLDTPTSPNADSYSTDDEKDWPQGLFRFDRVGSTDSSASFSPGLSIGSRASTDRLLAALEGTLTPTSSGPSVGFGTPYLSSSSEQPALVQGATTSEAEAGHRPNPLAPAFEPTPVICRPDSPTDPMSPNLVNYPPEDSGAESDAEDVRAFGLMVPTFPATPPTLPSATLRTPVSAGIACSRNSTKRLQEASASEERGARLRRSVSEGVLRRPAHAPAQELPADVLGTPKEDSNEEQFKTFGYGYEGSQDEFGGADEHKVARRDSSFLSLAPAFEFQLSVRGSMIDAKPASGRLRAQATVDNVDCEHGGLDGDHQMLLLPESVMTRSISDNAGLGGGLHADKRSTASAMKLAHAIRRQRESSLAMRSPKSKDPDEQETKKNSFASSVLQESKRVQRIPTGRESKQQEAQASFELPFLLLPSH